MHGPTLHCVDPFGLRCIAQRCIMPRCTQLQCASLHCSTRDCTALRCSAALPCAVRCPDRTERSAAQRCLDMPCIAPQRTARSRSAVPLPHYHALRCIALHCVASHRIASHRPPPPCPLLPPWVSLTQSGSPAASAPPPPAPSARSLAASTSTGAASMATRWKDSPRWPPSRAAGAVVFLLGRCSPRSPPPCCWAAAVPPACPPPSPLRPVGTACPAAGRCGRGAPRAVRGGEGRSVRGVRREGSALRGSRGAGPQHSAPLRAGGVPGSSEGKPRPEEKRGSASED